MMNGFVKVRNSMIRSHMESRDLYLYMYLDSKVYTNGMRQSYKDIAAEIGMGESTVKRAKASLESAGLIRAQHCYWSRGYAKNHYFTMRPPKEDYTKIPRYIFGLHLKPKVVHVYCAILSYMGQKNHAFPSLSTLVDVTGICRDTVIEAIKQLTVLNLISKNRRHYRKSRQTRAYRHNLYKRKFNFVKRLHASIRRLFLVAISVCAYIKNNKGLAQHAAFWRWSKNELSLIRRTNYLRKLKKKIE